MRRGNLAWILFVLALAIVCANVLAYSARHANPLPMSDEWVYLDAFVRKAAASDLSLYDFFVKRASMDHANPLRRLILLMHYEWFGLDYRVQGLVGVLFAFANLGLLWRIAAPERESRRSWWFLAAFLALASAHLSLNAGTIYTWPLLTTAFSNQTFVLLCVLQAWKANAEPTRRSALVLCGVAFAMDVAADDTALLAGIAIVLATLAWQWRGEDGRERVLRAMRIVALPLAIAYAAYKALYLAVTRGEVIATPLADPVGLGERLGALARHLPEYLAALHVPLAAAFARKSQLARMFGGGAVAAGWVLASLVLVAHAWFWWRVFARRTGRAGFAASVLMLLFYGGVAAILVGRASMHGADYFWQPRYVFVYQASVVALLLMAIDAMSSAPAVAPATGARRTPVVRVVAVGCACVLLLLQCQLSVATWGSARYSRGFQKKLARQIGELAAHPQRVPVACAPALIVCRYPPERRAELVGFLQDNRLNLFSPSFQARYRLHPGK
jgi:hypothetical protein